MNMMTNPVIALLPFAIPRPNMFRQQIETLVENLIGILDAMDEADGFEMNGDEFDGSLSEDDFHVAHNPFGGPGCPLADPDFAVDDEPCDDRNDDREEESYLFPFYAENQAEGPVRFDPANDRRKMQVHTDRVHRDMHVTWINSWIATRSRAASFTKLRAERRP